MVFSPCPDPDGATALPAHSKTSRNILHTNSLSEALAVPRELGEEELFSPEGDGGKLGRAWGCAEPTTFLVVVASQ